MRRHTRIKKSDPFLELPNDVNITEQPNPRSRQDSDKASEGDSLFADLVLAPLNMITFIISLVLVDEQQRQWRLSQHAPSSPPAWRRFAHWSGSQPEPYQDSDTSEWSQRAGASSRPASQRANSFQGWYARKKKRAIAKLEIGDALDMRGRVLVALIAWAVLGALALYYALRQVYKWLAA